MPDADWVPIGPRFSNSVLQALMVLLQKRPPKGRRLLILATTSNSRMLSDMELSDAFASEIRVPAIGRIESIIRVVEAVNLLTSEDEIRRLTTLMQQARLGETGFAIGVKRLLSLIEMARQDPDPADKFFNGLLMLLGGIDAAADVTTAALTLIV